MNKQPETISPFDISQGIEALANKDPHLATVIETYGQPEHRVWPTGFETFLSTIISQQISSQAARTIKARVCALFTDAPDAKGLLALPDGALRAAGLSGRKVEYATGLAQAVVEGRFVPEKLVQMGNNEAIDYIVALRGFGRWSAEIYLMFCLQRPDIFPAGDLAIRQALQKVNGLDNCPTDKQARELVQHWAPWRSVGSLVLWHFHTCNKTAQV